MGKFLTVQHVAEMLSCTTRQVYKMVHQGDLEAIRFRTHLRVDMASLQRYLAAHLHVPNPDNDDE